MPNLASQSLGQRFRLRMRNVLHLQVGRFNLSICAFDD